MENEVVVFISQVKKSKANKTVKRIHRKKTKSRLDARHTSSVRVVIPRPPPPGEMFVDMCTAKVTPQGVWCNVCPP